MAGLVGAPCGEMPLKSREFREQSCHWRRATQYYIPHEIYVETCDIGIIGADVHTHDSRGLILDVLFCMRYQGLAEYCSNM